MSYKPQNVAKFRSTAKPYPVGDSGINKGQVPGTTGSDDRESQLNDFLGDGNHENVNQQPGGSDFSLADGGMNDRLDSRKRANRGVASYNYNKPTL